MPAGQDGEFVSRLRRQTLKPCERQGGLQSAIHFQGRRFFETPPAPSATPTECRGRPPAQREIGCNQYGRGAGGDHSAAPTEPMPAIPLPKRSQGRPRNGPAPLLPGLAAEYGVKCRTGGELNRLVDALLLPFRVQADDVVAPQHARVVDRLTQAGPEPHPLIGCVALGGTHRGIQHQPGGVRRLIVIAKGIGRDLRASMWASTQA